MNARAELYSRLPLLDVDGWWLEQAAASPDGRVIELGAGAGRLTAAFLAAGLDVVAVERDPVMLARLRARTAGHAQIVAADAVSLPGIEPAGLVVLASSLLNELDDARAREAVLTNAARACRPDGTVAMHLLGPWWLVRLAGRSTGSLRPLAGGRAVEVTIDAGDFDPWRGRRRATLTYRFADGEVLTDELDAAVVTPSELERALAAAGLEPIGSSPAGAMTPDDAMLRLACRPRPGHGPVPGDDRSSRGRR